MKIKVVVAEDDQAICKDLEKIIKSEELKLELVAVVESEKQLYQLAADIQPELILLSCDINGFDALACIRNLREQEIKCKIVLMSSNRDFNTVYSAIQMEVDGYVLKPLPQDFLALLQKLSHEIRQVTIEQMKTEAHYSMRSLYFWKIMFENNVFSNDVSALNNLTNKKFRAGLFRVVLIRLEEIKDLSLGVNNLKYSSMLHDMQNYIKLFMNEYLIEYIYDMMHDYRFNGVLTIINYPEEKDQYILYKLPHLLKNLQKYFDEKYNVKISICVGGAYPQLKDVAKSREEAYNASWQRLKEGVGKIIYWKKSDNIELRFQEHLSNVKDQLKKVALNLNVEEFVKNIELLFSMSTDALSHRETNKVVLEFIDYFFDVNHETIGKHQDTDTLKEDIKRKLNFSHSFSQYKNNLKMSFIQILDLLGKDIEKQNVMPIRKAKIYLENNFSNSISVEDIANAVNLNPVYFSHLFKKHTGQNLTDYINNIRMEAAKRLLKTTNFSVKEISEKVGFQDQRYFSKKFNQVVGMTPSAFRKLG